MAEEKIIRKIVVAGSKAKDMAARPRGMIVPALLLMAGLALVGSGIFRAFNQRVVSVKGLAEKEVVADTAIWNIGISRVGDDLVHVQTLADADVAKVKKFLMGIGFKEDEVQLQRISVRDKFSGYSVEYMRNQIRENAKNGIKGLDRYVIGTGLTVRSNNVNLVDGASRRLGELVKQGIAIGESYNGPSYIYNGLNDIKVEMIERATKNAREAAAQFAKDADAAIGAIKSANQGVFSIEARDDAGDWNEKNHIKKKVRVVSTITYYLK